MSQLVGCDAGTEVNDIAVKIVCVDFRGVNLNDGPVFCITLAAATVTTSTDSGFTAVTGASQYLIMPKHMTKELAESMNINWKMSSIHRFENG